MIPNNKEQSGKQKIDNDTVFLRTLQKQAEDLETQIGALQLEYRRAGNNLNAQVAADLAYIHEAREEAKQITTILQGTALFGRYAQDADHHFKIANRWRAAAVAILIASPPAVAILAKVADLSGIELASSIAPVLVLFIYASVESHNHRRREFDRRRIALRVSAIEAFSNQRRRAGEAADQKAADKLLDEFVRKHFIEPDLDANDMTYIGPRFSVVTVLDRKYGSKTAPIDSDR